MLSRALYRTALIFERQVTGRTISHTSRITPRFISRPRGQHASPVIQRRNFATDKSIADERIEEIQEQYATARDEFEIAVEETEKKTVYAADDRAAAADELAKLKELFEAAIKDTPPDVAKEIQSRVGQRIRELDHAIQGLEKSAMED